jgi:hypothetical protein
LRNDTPIQKFTKRQACHQSGSAQEKKPNQMQNAQGSIVIISNNDIEETHVQKESFTTITNIA